MILILLSIALFVGFITMTYGVFSSNWTAYVVGGILMAMFTVSMPLYAYFTEDNKPTINNSTQNCVHMCEINNCAVGEK